MPIKIYKKVPRRCFDSDNFQNLIFPLGPTSVQSDGSVRRSPVFLTPKKVICSSCLQQYCHTTVIVQITFDVKQKWTEIYSRLLIKDSLDKMGYSDKVSDPRMEEIRYTNKLISPVISSSELKALSYF